MKMILCHTSFQSTIKIYYSYGNNGVTVQYKKSVIIIATNGSKIVTVKIKFNLQWLSSIAFQFTFCLNVDHSLSFKPGHYANMRVHVKKINVKTLINVKFNLVETTKLSDEYLVVVLNLLHLKSRK